MYSQASLSHLVKLYTGGHWSFIYLFFFYSEILLEIDSFFLKAGKAMKTKKIIVSDYLITMIYLCHSKICSFVNKVINITLNPYPANIENDKPLPPV